MKILLQHGSLRPRPSVERLVEQRLLALAARARLEEAVVRLHDERESSPRFRATVFLRVPGPDVHASASDRNVRDAVEKALDAAEAQIAARRGRRQARRRHGPSLAVAEGW